MKTDKKKIVSITSTICTIILLSISAILLIRNICFFSIVVSGNSMSPTLQDKQYGYAIKTKYAKTHINRFQIMIFEYGGEKDLIKRVIGLPGEKVSFDKDDFDLYIDGNLIEQNFITKEKQAKTGYNFKFDGEYESDSTKYYFHIPEGSYMVLGDNRDSSKDSLHGIGLVKQESVIGVLKCLIGTCDSIGIKNNNVVCSGKKLKKFVFFD